MATSSNTTGYAVLLLVAFLTHSYGFNIINTGVHSVGHRTRRMSPLFYKDIEPEIRSITIPPVMYFNVSSIAVEVDNKLYVADDSTITTEEKKSASKKSMRSNNKKSSSDAESSTPKETKTHDAVWHRQYDNLLQYKEEHGNCLVPQNFSQNRKLGLWVMQQRRQYSLLLQGKKSSLIGKRGEYRLRLLEEIGFVWRLERRGPRRTYGALGRTPVHAEHEIHTVANFEKYMIDADFTEDQKRYAWLKRFEVLQ